ncbi:MAG: hypothetical protein LH650_03105 [Chloroflexi bacterium]|nr:hypothetical protein [Chloroflexota bacterium]
MDTWLQAAAIGALALLIGLGFVFYGFKLFLILLPIWGFLFGAGVVKKQITWEELTAGTTSAFHAVRDLG